MREKAQPSPCSGRVLERSEELVQLPYVLLGPFDGILGNLPRHSSETALLDSSFFTLDLRGVEILLALKQIQQVIARTHNDSRKVSGSISTSSRRQLKTQPALRAA